MGSKSMKLPKLVSCIQNNFQQDICKCWPLANMLLLIQYLLTVMQTCWPSRICHLWNEDSVGGTYWWYFSSLKKQNWTPSRLWSCKVNGTYPTVLPCCQSREILISCYLGICWHLPRWHHRFSKVGWINQEAYIERCQRLSAQGNQVHAHCLC
jgi:hypothetical protein